MSRAKMVKSCEEDDCSIRLRRVAVEGFKSHARYSKYQSQWRLSLSKGVILNWRSQQ